MKTTTVAGVAALAVAIAAAIYLVNKSADEPVATSQSPSSESAESAVPAAQAQLDSRGGTVSPNRSADSKSAAADPRADPRLAALRVSPDNGLIEFVAGADGKVIKEIDKDPGSPSFRKPLREYTYSGDQVIGLTSYRYAGDQIQITNTAVSYNPDGSIDQYREQTNYDYGSKKPQGAR